MLYYIFIKRQNPGEPIFPYYITDESEAARPYGVSSPWTRSATSMERTKTYRAVEKAGFETTEKTLGRIGQQSLIVTANWRSDRQRDVFWWGHDPLFVAETVGS